MERLTRNLGRDRFISLYPRRVAVASAAATLFVCLIALSPARAEAAVRVFGLGDWLSSAAERSLNAVYEHISPGESREAKARLLRVVADRLVTGFAVDDVTFSEDFVFVRLRQQSPPPEWGVNLTPPNLREPVDGWFARDTAGLADELASRMEGVPLEALAWGDAELKRVVEDACADRLPGWRVSLMVRMAAEGRASLEVSFTPEQPLTLAVTPRISSTSIPVLLHSTLKEDLVKGFAPVIGLPVVWLDRHKDDFVALGKEILEGDSLVEQAKADPLVEVKTDSVSEVDIELESRRYAVWVWMGVYAGAEGKYPEVGLHFGRRAQPLPHWDAELYVELISSLEDFDLETRLGMRWSPWRNVWLGGEWTHPDHLWWLRAAFDARPKEPYAWIRLSEEGDTNGALGLRINDIFSIEIHYDSRDDDSLNIRALVNL